MTGYTNNPIRINFPGGAGGNWLMSMLTLEPISSEPVMHWHSHIKSKKWGNPFVYVHTLDHCYDLLYSGHYYFNFYLNLLFKRYFIDGFFLSTYQQRFDKMFEVAMWLYDWSQMHKEKQVDISFDDLVSNHLTFFTSVRRIQKEYDLPYIELEEFEIRRNLFFGTCVNSGNLFENFDNMLFVIFVLAWLEKQGHFPHEQTHFIMNDPENQYQCKVFASERYHLCPALLNHVFDAGRNCPDFLSNF